MAIIDQIIAKLCTWRGEAYTRRDLIYRCKWAIERDGVNATEEFWMRGKEGGRTKKTRRIFSKGPAGTVMGEEYGLPGFLHMRFYCKDLLIFVGDDDGLISSTMEYLRKNELNLFTNPELADVMALRTKLCEVEIEDDLMHALIDYAIKEFRRSELFCVVNGLLQMDKVAQSRGWKSVNKNNWGTKSFLSSPICQVPPDYRSAI
jgi:hypothetical protein